MKNCRVVYYEIYLSELQCLSTLKLLYTLYSSTLLVIQFYFIADKALLYY